MHSEHSIATSQNSREALTLLAAFSNLYSRAKLLMGLQLILVVVVAVLLSIIGAVFSVVSPYAALYGITISIIDVAFLEESKRRLQTTAAKVQELFDCKVLQLNWNKLVAGSKPEPETITEAAKRYQRKKDNSKLQNWYPVGIDELSVYQGRVVCQRTNAWYDAQLRQKFSGMICLSLAVSLVTVFAIALSTDLSVERFILVVLAPMLSFILWSIREVRRQRITINHLDHLRESINSFWQIILSGDIGVEEADTESRCLQDQIYNHRRLSPMVFNFVYDLFRSSSEQTMNEGADTLIQELKEQRGNIQ